MHSLLLEVRSALRFFARRKIAALVAVLTIGLALGANTAVFTALNTFLRTSLGVPAPERVQQIASMRELPGRGLVEFYNAWPAYELLAREARTFLAIGAVQFGDFVWDNGTGGEPRRLLGARVTCSTFDVWQTTPHLGRIFRPDEEGPTAARVVLISHALWRSAFGQRENVVGETMRLAGVPHEIVGVMPENFSLPPDTEIWLPQEVPADLRARGFGAKIFAIYARLGTDTQPAAAAEELKRMDARMAELDAANREWTLRARPLREVLLDGSDRALWLIQAGALVLLLLAAANVASLQLAWAAERQTETAVRLAIGAPTHRLVRQFLVQSLLLATAGGAVGALLALAALPLWGKLNPSPEIAFLVARVEFDFAAGCFSAALVGGAALLAGLLPAWQARRTDLVDSLRCGAKGGTASRTSLRAQQAMSFLQTAIAVLVLTAAALVGYSFRQLLSVPLGFQAEQRAVVRVQLPASAYASGADRARFALRVLDELQRRGDVIAAGWTTTLPVSDTRQRTGFSMEGVDGKFSDETVPLHTRGISPGYLASLGATLRAGRAIERRDLAPEAPRVALVSEVVARKYWGASSPLGRRVRRTIAGQSELFEIVGVVANLRDSGPLAPEGETIYLPIQATVPRRLSLLVHSAASASAALAAAQEAVRATDPTLATFAPATLQELVERANALPRLQTTLLALFAAMATTVALLGAYGVTSQLVASRQREFAVRLALGATSGEVRWATLRRAARLSALAALCGAGLALAFARALGAWLPGLDGPLWIPFLAAASATALLQIASALPLWRGTRIDLARALAGE